MTIYRHIVTYTQFDPAKRAHVERQAWFDRRRRLTQRGIERLLRSDAKANAFYEVGETSYAPRPLPDIELPCVVRLEVFRIYPAP